MLRRPAKLMSKFQVQASVPVEPPKSSVLSEPDGLMQLSAEDQLHALMAELTMEELDLILAAEAPEKKVKKKKQAGEPELVRPLPQMYVVATTYHCQLCGNLEEKEYKCTKPVSLVNAVHCNWCPSCLARLQDTAPQIQPALERLLPVYKKQVAYVKQVIYAKEA